MAFSRAAFSASTCSLLRRSRSITRASISFCFSLYSFFKSSALARAAALADSRDWSSSSFLLAASKASAIRFFSASKFACTARSFRRCCSAIISAFLASRIASFSAFFSSRRRCFSSSFRDCSRTFSSSAFWRSIACSRASSPRWAARSLASLS